MVSDPKVLRTVPRYKLVAGPVGPEPGRVRNLSSFGRQAPYGSSKRRIGAGCFLTLRVTGFGEESRTMSWQAMDGF